MSPSTTIVIPCFNEAERLDASEIAEMLSDPSVGLLFVDDGSTDATLTKLGEFSQIHGDRVQVLVLAKNVGKAEAVRNGMLQAIVSGAEVTGYLDADFATPAVEMLRLISILRETQQKQILLAARWSHLGANIERKAFRHYCGRIFATIASLVLDLKVYDTQCGAKLFKVNEGLETCLKQPFLSRWAFDVELIGRLRRVNDEQNFLEVPLNTWIDIAGSKMGLLSMLQATCELFLIWRALKKL